MRRSCPTLSTTLYFNVVANLTTIIMMIYIYIYIKVRSHQDRPEFGLLEVLSGIRSRSFVFRRSRHIDVKQLPGKYNHPVSYKTKEIVVHLLIRIFHPFDPVSLQRGQGHLLVKLV